MAWRIVLRAIDRGKKTTTRHHVNQLWWKTQGPNMTDLGRIKKRVSTGGKAAGKRILTSAPRSDDDFMTRIQLALDMTPRQLADALDVDTEDVVDRVGPRANMSSSVTDPFWNVLLHYVNERVAGLLAVKEELDRKLRMDQREYIERMEKTRGKT